jgi:hypothetical protein
VLDALQEKLLDANRTIGQPDKLTILFGRRVSRKYNGRLQTTIEDRHLGSPVIRSYFRSSSAKQYVRDHKNHMLGIVGTSIATLSSNLRARFHYSRSDGATRG